MAKSYYAILGIASNASEAEVKSAYRRLAKQYHPDRCPGGGDTFKDIHEAYCVLGDPEKRQQYERQNAPKQVRVRRRPPSYPGAEPLIPEDDPMQTRRTVGRRSVSSFATETPEDLFDWFLRHFF